MQNTQSFKNRVCFRAVLLALICMLFLSLFSSIDIGILIQGFKEADINQDSVSSRGIDRVDQNPMAVICVQQTSFYENAQRLLSSKNNSYMMTFLGTANGLFFRKTHSFVSLRSRISVCKINYFLIASHFPNAPPYFLA